MTGGMIWPPVDATDLDAPPRNARGKPLRFISGMVIGPSTITLATARAGDRAEQATS